MAEKTAPREVVIDGVRYVPAIDVSAAPVVQAVRAALIAEHWPDHLGPVPHYFKPDNMFMIFTDNPGPDDAAVTVDEFIEKLTARLANEVTNG